MMRKLCIGGMALIFCLLKGGSIGCGQEVHPPRGELRLVDTSPLTWISVALNVFDRLIELDADGRLVPGLASGWRWLDDRTLEVKLRQGVQFQNGAGFDAEVVKCNGDAYSRLQQPYMAGEFLNFKVGSRLEVLDPSTLRLRFPERAVDRQRQQTLIQQIDRHTHEQAYFLFLYNPDQLYAVNKAVTFVPHATTLFTFVETSATDEHWSVRRTSLQPALSETQPRHVDQNSAEHVAVGQQVYVSFCAGCHGPTLEGQPDWQKRLPMGNFPAPPHDATGHAWHHADRWLFDIIKDGGQRFAPPRYRSAMPASRDMLTDEEIWAVLAFIKSRWPSSIRAQQERLNARGQ